MLLIVLFVLGGGSMLINVVCFGRGFFVAHRCLFWEGNPCRSSFFVLGGGSLLLIVLFVLGGGSMLLNVVCFEREFVLLIVFLFWEGDPCW